MASAESAFPAPAADPSAARSSSSDAFVSGALVAEVLAPISKEAPCGVDATYDDDFQLVKGKINALSSFSGRIDQEKALAGGDESFVAAADASERSFAVIEETSRRLLRETSKDLRIACYLVLALGHERGLTGAADGLAALRALVDAYWEDLHPERLRARQGALTFLFRRLSSLFDETEPAPEDRALLKQVLDDLQVLQAALVNEMGEEAPSTSSLKKTFEVLLRRVPELPPAPRAAASAAESASEKAPEKSGAGEEAVHAETAPRGEDAQRAREKAPPARQEGSAGAGGEALPPPGEALTAQQANQHLLRLATVMRQQDDTRVAPYRIARALRWDALRALPPHDDETYKTRIPAPPTQRCAYLLGLHEKKNHQRLVGAAEDSFHQPPFHFWLDLQRLLAQALDARGASHEAAAQAVRRECALLLERLPKLSRLRFRNGTPFARPATREGLETSARPALNGSAGSQGAGENTRGADKANARDALDEQFQKARFKLGTSDLPGALRLMETAAPARTAFSRRADFRRRLFRARLCLRAGRPAIARPIFEALGKEADQRGLSTWDPPLALEVWVGLHACLTALLERSRQRKGQKSTAQHEQRRRSEQEEALEKERLEARAARAFDRICTIDPEQALATERNSALPLSGNY